MAKLPAAAHRPLRQKKLNIEPQNMRSMMDLSYVWRSTMSKEILGSLFFGLNWNTHPGLETWHINSISPSWYIYARLIGTCCAESVKIRVEKWLGFTSAIDSNFCTTVDWFIEYPESFHDSSFRCTWIISVMYNLNQSWRFRRTWNMQLTNNSNPDNSTPTISDEDEDSLQL